MRARSRNTVPHLRADRDPARSARLLPWPGVSAWCFTGCGGMARSFASRVRRRWRSGRHRRGCIPPAFNRERREGPRLKVATHRCPLAGTRFPMMHVRPLSAEPLLRVRARYSDRHSGIALDQARCWRPTRRPRTEARAWRRTHPGSWLLLKTESYSNRPILNRSRMNSGTS